MMPHIVLAPSTSKNLYLNMEISAPRAFMQLNYFHTIEGGAVFTKDPDLLKRMLFMRNFGHSGPETFEGLGVNGKNCEFHAAMGLCNLKYVDQILGEEKNAFVALFRKTKKC